MTSLRDRLSYLVIAVSTGLGLYAVFSAGGRLCDFACVGVSVLREYLIWNVESFCILFAGCACVYAEFETVNVSVAIIFFSAVKIVYLKAKSSFADRRNRLRNNYIFEVWLCGKCTRTNGFDTFTERKFL